MAKRGAYSAKEGPWRKGGTVEQGESVAKRRASSEKEGPLRKGRLMAKGMPVSQLLPDRNLPA